ncbi:hypothetical protein GmHk_03G006486 [Glycine max]|nr:hypothetical protein GmHk_03G006486 [Glycine max]
MVDTSGTGNMKIARLFPGLGKDRRGHGFKHLDLQQCEKFKEFGAPEFHHDCAKELEIHNNLIRLEFESNFLT